MPAENNSFDMTRLLEATAAMTSTLELHELLKTIMQSACELFKTEVSSILLIDPITEELYFHSALGSKEDLLKKVRLQKGQGIAGWVAVEQKPAIVNDVSQDPRWTQVTDATTQFKTRAILAVPMLVKNKLIGVMEVINPLNGKLFQNTDRQLLEIFASQAAIAVENARLFESIREEKEKVAIVFNEMKEGAVVVSLAGDMTNANPAAERLLGISAVSTVPWQTILERFESSHTLDALQSVSEPIRIELKRKERPLFLLSGLWTALRDTSQAVKGYLFVFQDVTDERRELQLKRNFLSLVSHKLRTPLVSIRGFTPLLLERPEELNSMQLQALRSIDKCGIELASLVEKLLHFATIESDRIDLMLETQTLEPLVATVVRDMAPYCKAQHAKIIVDKTISRLPAVHIDAERISDVIRNVIENAIKFNPHLERTATLSGTTDGAWVQLHIADNGRGIPLEEQQKVFSTFYQVDPDFTGRVEGMGLGLSLSKRLVEEHKGHIEIHSKPGEGSIFTISLPTVNQPPA